MNREQLIARQFEHDHFEEVRGSVGLDCEDLRRITDPVSSRRTVDLHTGISQYIFPQPRNRPAQRRRRDHPGLGPLPLLNMSDSNADAGERSPATTTVVGPLLLTALEAAQLLSIGRTSVYELISAGDLETVHIGRSMRIPADSVQAFVALRRRRP